MTVVTRTGRPREFDRDEALARARDLFWTQGYANTSVQDLVDELAVQRGSLYGAFGDKRALYLEAVGSTGARTGPTSTRPCATDRCCRYCATSCWSPDSSPVRTADAAA